MSKREPPDQEYHDGDDGDDVELLTPRHEALLRERAINIDVRLSIDAFENNSDVATARG